MRVCIPQSHQLLDHCGIRLPRAAVRTPGQLLVAVLTVFFIPVDPLMRCLSRDAEAFGEIADGVVVQLEVFEKPLPLLAHGNTFPRHGSPPPPGKCYPCP